MFGRRRKSERESLPEHLRSGWTDSLLLSFVGEPQASGGTDLAGRERTTKRGDYDIGVVGLGQSVNKFAVERVIYGWATCRDIELYVPALVSIHLDAEPGFPDGDGVVAPEPDQMADEIGEWEQRHFAQVGMSEETLAALREARRSRRHRHQVGYVYLSYRDRGYGSDSWKIPAVEASLRLTAVEWEPVRECFTMAADAKGRGPTLGIRVELPLPLGPADLIANPSKTSYPITRFWSEAVVAYGSKLSDHPIFRSQAGGTGSGWM